MARSGLLPTPRGTRDDLIDMHTALERVVDKPLRRAPATIGAEVANTRTITLQVRDRINRPVTGRFVVELWISTSSGGGPGGTQTVSVSSGTIMQTIAANQQYELLTAADGTLAIDITITGAASRWVSTIVRGEAVETDQIDWA